MLKDHNFPPGCRASLSRLTHVFLHDIYASYECDGTCAKAQGFSLRIRVHSVTYQKWPLSARPPVTDIWPNFRHAVCTRSDLGTTSKTAQDHLTRARQSL